jgi:putative FmdB family regulatory protein
MPIYEYKCNRCDHMFEVYRLISERDEDVKCPSCGTAESEKLLSSFFGKCGFSLDSSGSTSSG